MRLFKQFKYYILVFLYREVLANEIIIKFKFKIFKSPSIRQFSNRIKAIDDCVNLTIGQPDFPMPDVVKMLISKQSKTIKQVILITKVYLKHAKLLANILNENIISFIVRKKSSLLMVRVKH